MFIIILLGITAAAASSNNTTTTNNIINSTQIQQAAQKIPAPPKGLFQEILTYIERGIIF
jgi:hypothetical protein